MIVINNLINNSHGLKPWSRFER